MKWGSELGLFPLLKGRISLIFLIIIQTKDLPTSMIVKSLLTLRNQCGRFWCKWWLKDFSSRIWLRVQPTWFIRQVLLMELHSLPEEVKQSRFSRCSTELKAVGYMFEEFHIIGCAWIYSKLYPAKLWKKKSVTYSPENTVHTDKSTPVSLLLHVVLIGIQPSRKASAVANDESIFQLFG